SMAMDFGLSAIGQISVNAKDLERAVDFYQNKLGMKHLFTVPPNMAFFDCAGIRLMLALPDKKEVDHPSSLIYFHVVDIQQAHATIAQRGVKFEEKPEFAANRLLRSLARFLSRLGKQPLGVDEQRGPLTQI